jgi:hypothetical protein
VRGDYFSDATLKRAAVESAKKVLVLADSLESHAPSEVDSKTVMTVLAVKAMARDSYTVAVPKSEYNVFFGKLALIDDDPRSATVIARENSVFLVISKDDFLDLGKKHPEYALPIIRTIRKASRQGCARRRRTCSRSSMPLSKRSSPDPDPIPLYAFGASFSFSIDLSWYTISPWMRNATSQP